jgi:uncharacterized membrane protein
LFSGTPHVAGFQSAVFYPLNIHYFLLPLAAAMNLEILLHFFLLGVFMYAWSRNRGNSRAASFFASAVFMFSGSSYLHVYAGHLAYVSSLAWTPLAFLATDKLIDAGRARWAGIGAIALTLGILAGHPQAMFVSLIALLPYAAYRLYQSRNRMQKFVWLASLFMTPAFISAARNGLGHKDFHCLVGATGASGLRTLRQIHLN